MFEGTDRLNAALSSGMMSQLVMVASARSVGWGSNEAVASCINTLSRCTDVQDGNTQFRNISDQRP